MEDEAWARVMLSACRSTGRVRRCAERAIAGFSDLRCRPRHEDAARQLEALGSLLGKAERAARIEERVLGALRRLPPADARLLVLRWIRRVPAVRLAETFGVSRRTAYRRADAALAAFSVQLAAREPAGEREAFLSDAWFRCVAEESCTDGAQKKAPAAQDRSGRTKSVSSPAQEARSVSSSDGA